MVSIPRLKEYLRRSEVSNQATERLKKLKAEKKKENQLKVFLQLTMSPSANGKFSILRNNPLTPRNEGR